MGKGIGGGGGGQLDSCMRGTKKRGVQSQYLLLVWWR